MKDIMIFDLPLTSILDEIYSDLARGSRKNPEYMNTWRVNIPGLIKSKYPTKPPMDHILKTDGTNIFKIAASNMNKDDIIIEREGTMIYITAKMSNVEPLDERDIVLHHTLIAGDFSVPIKVPNELDIENVDVTVKEGVLTIVIPPKPEHKLERKPILIK